MEPLAKLSIIGVVVATLAACTTAGTAIVLTPPDQGHVLFEARAFAASTPHRVTFVDAWQEEEYVRFDGAGAQAEIIYAVADERDSIVLDFPLTLAHTIATWRINSANALSWGEKGEVEARLETFQYQRYTLTGANRPCFGFSTEWDYRAGDLQVRPAKVLFGYYCGKVGSDLDPAQVAGILSKIWVIGIRRIDFRFTPRLALARSTGAVTGVETGNLGFPFAMADMFMDGDGEPPSGG